MAQPIETQMLYLQRLDKYKAEKPFEVAFNVSEFGVDAVQTSVCLAAQPVKVVDARSTWGDYRMDKHGFEFHRLATALKGDDFEDERLIREIYFPEVEAFLYQTIGKKLAHVLIFHHQRRKRSETFPHIDPGNTKYFQPIPRVHCDYSPDGAKPKLESYISQHEQLQDLPFQIMNVWRVSRGPNVDWPLAVCDYNTLDLAHDIEQCDHIERTMVTESVQLYHNPGHVWHFLDEQSTEEVILFRNCDSRGYHIPFSPHAAFDHQPTTPKAPRESFEVRVACFLWQ